MSIIVDAALNEAIEFIRKKIADCAYLLRQDSKQSEKNKEYFEGLIEEYKQAIEIIKGFGK